ncbi:Hypothetical predicted protein [Olea europaea subsp. europaea]|uniref:Uncharacterized protein n=1 Tax=Olea europaea subsp. europaea TaxID=158383 RepID=A0A8S0SNK3_OLEEU|nr:Hypothetical predicted protein [Olea europaea subsp. europaea]
MKNEKAKKLGSKVGNWKDILGIDALTLGIDVGGNHVWTVVRIDEESVSEILGWLWMWKQQYFSAPNMEASALPKVDGTFDGQFLSSSEKEGYLAFGF